MRIELEVSTENEGTRTPWWMVIDPHQMMSPSAATVAMCMVFGPFFSRAEAEEYIRRQSHNLSKRAVAWCAGAPYGMETQYAKAYQAALLKEDTKCNKN